MFRSFVAGALTVLAVEALAAVVALECYRTILVLAQKVTFAVTVPAVPVDVPEPPLEPPTIPSFVDGRARQ